MNEREKELETQVARLTRENRRREQRWTLVVRPILEGLLKEFGFAHSAKCPAADKMGQPGYDPSLCDREVCLVAQAQAQLANPPTSDGIAGSLTAAEAEAVARRVSELLQDFGPDRLESDKGRRQIERDRENLVSAVTKLRAASNKPRGDAGSAKEDR